MFDVLRTLAQIIIPIFVVSTMLNVGLTQKLGDVLRYLMDWPFVVKMLFANFILVPLLMFVVLKVTSFDPALRAGLLLFSLCAGAPFLIKLTQLSQHDVALGAATMILLVVATAYYVPIVLPTVLTGLAVDPATILKSMVLQMIAPIALGMLAVILLPGLTRIAQPWIGRVSNTTLYVVIGTTLLGYLPNILDILGTGAILASVLFVAAAFGIGYLICAGDDQLQDIGGLGTAQRNTAAGLIVAAQDFINPNVLVMLTLANTLGIVLLIVIAKAISRDNEVVIAHL